MLLNEETVLSKREMQVIQLISRGCSNKEIAARLHITLHTAKGHVHNILQKLQLTSRLAAAIWYMERRRALQSINSRLDPAQLELVQSS